MIERGEPGQLFPTCSPCAHHAEKKGGEIWNQEGEWKSISKWTAWWAL